MVIDPAQTVFIKDTMVFLIATGVLIPLLKVIKLPSVVGFILMGIALGPYGLGQYGTQFPFLNYLTLSDPKAAQPFAELGVLFLLFLIGLELSFRQLWVMRRTVFATGGVQVAVSSIVIGGMAMVFLNLTAIPASVIGLALALSSTAVVMKLLADARRAATPVGQTALGVLLFQDIMVAPILIFCSFALQDTGQSLGSVLIHALIEGLFARGFIFLLGRYGIRRSFRLAAKLGGREFLMALTLLAVVGAAIISASAGLSVALGAFLIGLLLGETEFKHQLEVDLEPFKGLLLGLFFMTVGMEINLKAVYELSQHVALGVAGVLLLKLCIAVLACRISQKEWRTCLQSAFLLAPAGEFAFVIIAAAQKASAFPAEVNTIVTTIAGLSILLIPLFSRLGVVLSDVLYPTPSPVSGPQETYQNLQGHVLIAGYGRIGQAITRILKQENVTIVALERQSERVYTGRKLDTAVYYGDATRFEILEKAGVHGAAMCIVTTDDPVATQNIVATLRTLRPNFPIIVRAQDTDHASQLRQSGATHVILDAVEAGLHMAEHALETFGYEPETARTQIACFRDLEYQNALSVKSPSV